MKFLEAMFCTTPGIIAMLSTIAVGGYAIFVFFVW